MNSEDAFLFSSPKDAYTPYTLFEGVFLTEKTDIANIKEVIFSVDQTDIHYGLLDSVDFCTLQGYKIIKVKIQRIYVPALSESAQTR